MYIANWQSLFYAAGEEKINGSTGGQKTSRGMVAILLCFTVLKTLFYNIIFAI